MFGSMEGSCGVQGLIDDAKKNALPAPSASEVSVPQEEGDETGKNMTAEEQEKDQTLQGKNGAEDTAAGQTTKEDEQRRAQTRIDRAKMILKALGAR